MDINLFKFCSGLKVLGYFMILLVASIIAVSYYAVVLLTWGPHLLRGGGLSILSFLIVIVFHFLLVMLVWCYFMVVFTDPGSVPENLRLRAEEYNSEASIVCLTSTDDGLQEASDAAERRLPVGYCAHCQNSKPPRCHHCSLCSLMARLTCWKQLYFCNLLNSRMSQRINLVLCLGDLPWRPYTPYGD